MASPKAESKLGPCDPEAYEEVIFGDRSMCTWGVMWSRKREKSISGCTIKVTTKIAEAQYHLELLTHTWGFGAAQAGSETSLMPNARESWWARPLIKCDTFKNVCVS